MVYLTKIDEEKFREVLIYVLNRLKGQSNVGKTVLYKLLYFIDFDFYELYERPLTGATYRKKNFGPVPEEFDVIVQDMERKGDIKVDIRSFYGYVQFHYTPLREPDLSKLTEEEIAVIDNVIERLGHMNAKEISEYSHGDIPWIGADYGEVIPYEAVFYRTKEYSVRKTNEDEPDIEEISLNDIL